MIPPGAIACAAIVPPLALLKVPNLFPARPRKLRNLPRPDQDVCNSDDSGGEDVITR